MRNHSLQRYPYVLAAFMLVIAIGGCSGRGNQTALPTISTASPSPSVANTALPTASPMPVLTPTTTTAPIMEPATDSHLHYQDDFSDPTSGWSQEKFDNYFIGYHEPDYYHIDIRSANDKELVFTPEKKSYSDATIETTVFTDPSNTATTGDFRYGPAFRRSGDQYYAFTVSPRTKQWYVLKSSPSALVVLKEGNDASIQGLEGEDTLRVDVKGSTFFFHINDHLVDQVSDPDYAEGEVGFYVQTFDSQHAHVHFDSVAIRDVEAPQLKCTVIATAIRVRSGPSTAFDPILFLPSGESIEALGRSRDGNWIQVKAGASGQSGWVYNSDGFVSCNFSAADLPVINP
jgi:hypothetical protein